MSQEETASCEDMPGSEQFVAEYLCGCTENMWCLAGKIAESKAFLLKVFCRDHAPKTPMKVKLIRAPEEP